MMLGRRKAREYLARRAPGERCFATWTSREQAGFLVAASSSQGQQGMSEWVRRYPSNTPLPSVELLAQLPQWQRGQVIDLGER